MKTVHAIVVAAMLGTSLLAAPAAMAMPPDEIFDDHVCLRIPFTDDWICIPIFW